MLRLELSKMPSWHLILIEVDISLRCSFLAMANATSRRSYFDVFIFKFIFPELSKLLDSMLFVLVYQQRHESVSIESP